MERSGEERALKQLRTPQRDNANSTGLFPDERVARFAKLGLRKEAAILTGRRRSLVYQ
jgi:hypothetical protein